MTLEQRRPSSSPQRSPPMQPGPRRPGHGPNRWPGPDGVALRDQVDAILAARYSPAGGAGDGEYDVGEVLESARALVQSRFGGASYPAPLPVSPTPRPSDEYARPGILDVPARSRGTSPRDGSQYQPGDDRLSLASQHAAAVLTRGRVVGEGVRGGGRPSPAVVRRTIIDVPTTAGEEADHLAVSRRHRASVYATGDDELTVESLHRMAQVHEKNLKFPCTPATPAVDLPSLRPCRRGF